MNWMSSDGRTVVELIRITDPGFGRDAEKLRRIDRHDIDRDS